MKINFQTKGVIITSKQKSYMEKKLSRLKKYCSSDPMTIDLVLIDESSAEKGGVDQAVHIASTFGKEKIFIEEIDDRLMRAFAFAFKRFERACKRNHQKRIVDQKKPGGHRFEKVLRIIRRKKKNNKNK